MKRKSSFRSKALTPKAVRFAPSSRNRVRRIPHIQDVLHRTHGTLADLWYTDLDYSRIKLVCAGLAFRVEHGVFDENDKNGHTQRGLEAHIPHQAWERRSIIQKALHAVLDEQDRQWKCNVKEYDVNALERIYLAHSMPCTIVALQRGRQDAVQAKEICQDIVQRRSLRMQQQQSQQLPQSPRRVQTKNAAPVSPSLSPATRKIRSVYGLIAKNRTASGKSNSDNRNNSNENNAVNNIITWRRTRTVPAATSRCRE